MSLGARLRRTIENVLPYYDEKAERERAQRAEASEKAAAAELIRAADVRAAYKAMADRMPKRP